MYFQSKQSSQSKKIKISENSCEKAHTFLAMECCIRLLLSPHVHRSRRSQRKMADMKSEEKDGKVLIAQSINRIMLILTLLEFVLKMSLHYNSYRQCYLWSSIELLNKKKSRKGSDISITYSVKFSNQMMEFAKWKWIKWAGDFNFKSDGPFTYAEIWIYYHSQWFVLLRIFLFLVMESFMGVFTRLKCFILKSIWDVVGIYNKHASAKYFIYAYS